MAVIQGMFGTGNTYFANNPVVITVKELEFPADSPIKVCKVKASYNGRVVGEFSGDVGNETSIEFDISSALRAIWADESLFAEDVEQAQLAADSQGTAGFSVTRPFRGYSLEVFMEYLDSTDGKYEEISSGVFNGGQCVTGGRTEMERLLVEDIAHSDVSALQHSNPRNGDASTKPTSSPERVGSMSITSWVDVDADGTRSIFYPAAAEQEEDDPDGRRQDDQYTGHAPIVLRDDVPYVDFLFLNRRGAVETCSALMLENMGIAVEAKQYGLTGKPSFKPVRALMNIATGGRRTWSMSSGHQTREWAEWWTLEFLMARKRWMRYNGKFLPVTVEPAKKVTPIYDRTKQEMPSVEFNVTLAYEG